jgi:hypothetical protein
VAALAALTAMLQASLPVLANFAAVGQRQTQQGRTHQGFKKTHLSTLNNS